MLNLFRFCLYPRVLIYLTYSTDKYCNLRYWIIYVYFVLCPKVYFIIAFGKMVKKKLVGTPNKTGSRFAPRPIFDYSKIPNTGIKICGDQPLPAARKMITRGLNAVKERNTIMMRLWRRLTGLDTWRWSVLPTLNEEDCFQLRNTIYLILDLKKPSIRYIGHTTQRLDKRLSDHIRNMKFLQRYGEFEKDTHKSLLSYRLSVNGVYNLCAIPWLHFETMIDSSWPLPGTADFRHLVEERYEFPLADALHCF